MAILVSCGCGKRFQTSDENGGRRSRCLDCGRELFIPRAKRLSGSEPEDAVAPPVRTGLEASTSGKAIASFLLGFCSFGCALLTGIPAVVVGLIGLREVKQSQGLLRGRGIAHAGIALGLFGSTVMSYVLFVPAVDRLLSSSRERACAEQLKRIALAVHEFSNRHDRFPPAAITDRQGQPLLSWRVAILPFLGPEGEALYGRFHLNEPWDSPNNVRLLNERPDVFACPGDRSIVNGGLTTYRVIVAPRSMFTGTKKGVRLSEITDGMSNTLMVVETSQAVPWTAPQEIVPGASSTPLMGMGSHHVGGFQAVFADGSVQFVDGAISQQLLDSMTTRDGGEPSANGAFLSRVGTF